MVAISTLDQRLAWPVLRYRISEMNSKAVLPRGSRWGFFLIVPILDILIMGTLRIRLDLKSCFFLVKLHQSFSFLAGIRKVAGQITIAVLLRIEGLAQTARNRTL